MRRIEDYRAKMHQMVDLIADYYADIEKMPVKTDVKPHYLKQELPVNPPEDPVPFDQTLSTIQESMIKGTNHWQHPMFNCYFPCIGGPSAIMGDMIAGMINNPGFSWACSPINTELEEVVTDWMVNAMGLPGHFLHSSGTGGGVLQTTATEAHLMAMLSVINRSKLTKFSVYHNDQTHFCAMKNSTLLRAPYVRVIDTEFDQEAQNYVFSIPKLEAQIEADKAEGITPIFLTAMLGSTSSCAIDPIPELQEICTREKIWLHVDAAYAGPALLLPEFKELADQMAEVDSFNFNGHKWMMTGFDCSFLYVKDKQVLINAGKIDASYITRTAADDVIDFRDWQVALGRKFRSIRVWMVLQEYGLSGIRDHLRKHIDLATKFANLVSEDSRLQIDIKPKFALVTFRVRDDEKRTQALCNAVKARTDIYMDGTVIHGKTYMRYVVCSTMTEEKHVERAWEIIQEEMEKIFASDQ